MYRLEWQHADERHLQFKDFHTKIVAESHADGLVHNAERHGKKWKERPRIRLLNATEWPADIRRESTEEMPLPIVAESFVAPASTEEWSGGGGEFGGGGASSSWDGSSSSSSDSGSSSSDSGSSSSYDSGSSSYDSGSCDSGSSDSGSCGGGD